MESKGGCSNSAVPSPTIPRRGNELPDIFRLAETSLAFGRNRPEIPDEVEDGKKTETLHSEKLVGCTRFIRSVLQLETSSAEQ